MKNAQKVNLLWIFRMFTRFIARNDNKIRQNDIYVTYM